MRTALGRVATIGLAAAVVVGGATASSGAAVAAPAAPDRAADGAARLVAAAARDLGLAPDKVRARFARERTAAHTLAALRARLGDAYAGGWVSGDGATVVAAVTDADAAGVVRAAGAVPQIVARSARALAGDLARLDASAKSAPAGVHGWWVDVTTNRVVVAAETTTAAVAFAAAAGVDARAEVSAAPRIQNDVRGGDPYYPNGSPGHCSIGFSVQGGFVTAGHCGEAGDSALGAGRVDQGTFAGSSFPENDYAWVRTNADWTPLGVVYDYAGGTVPVAGATVAPVGAAICRSGFTTGWRCGVVEAHNQTVNYAEGTVNGLTRTTACSQAGDSGGSFIAGDQAQGVLSGGSGTCSSTNPGRTYYQPVAEILSVYGLTLVTSSGSACDGSPSTGSLSRAGAVQYKPGSGGFAAVAGFVHRACLTGPAGANFNLQLQRRTGTFTWTTVARSEGPTSTETIEYTGVAGTYRYRVASASGSGAYSLTYTR